MLPTSQLVQKALTLTTNLAALTPKLWAAQIEYNLRRMGIWQQSIISNTDLLVPNAGDTVYVPTLPDVNSVVALTEGTDMTVIALNNASSIALTPTEYGLTIGASRKALDRIKYDGVAAIVDRLAYAMSFKIETMISNLVSANVPGTTGSGFANGQLGSIYPNGHATGTIVATDIFNDALIWAGVQYLQLKDNIPFEDGQWRLYMDPAQWAALIQDQNIRQDIRFAAPEKMLVGEVATIHNCRIFVTNYIAQTAEGAAGAVTVRNAVLCAPRWAVIAWKRMPGVVVDPTLYDLGRRRNFGITADFDIELLHNERAVVIKTA